MNKPNFTECPICGELCFKDDPHDEIVVREYKNRKRVVYVHYLCSPWKFKEIDIECGTMWDEL